MDVISDHSQAKGEQPAAQQFDHRIRWGNVALALAALVAIVAAIGLPRTAARQSVEQSVAPVTELVTESVPTAPTADTAEPRPKRASKKPAKRKPRKQKQSRQVQPKQSAPATSTPSPTPVPAPPPAPDQPPAAEREFGL
jgi:hypothetical protein